MGIDTLIKSEILLRGSFYSAVHRACLDPDVKKAIETGAGMGDGATMAIIAGLQKKSIAGIKFYPIELSRTKTDQLKARVASFAFAIPINGNTIGTGSFMTDAQARAFYWAHSDSTTRLFETDDLKKWRAEELDYISKRTAILKNNALTFAIGELSDDLDFILINQSDFTTDAELTIALETDPIYIALYDTKSIRSYSARVALLANSDYKVFEKGTEAGREWIIFQHN